MQEDEELKDMEEKAKELKKSLLGKSRLLNKVRTLSFKLILRITMKL